jgi:hypothetical protein
VLGQENRIIPILEYVNYISPTAVGGRGLGGVQPACMRWQRASPALFESTRCHVNATVPVTRSPASLALRIASASVTNQCRLDLVLSCDQDAFYQLRREEAVFDNPGCRA